MMTEKDAQSLLIDYLYGDLDGDLKREFEACLDRYPELKKELDELSEAREILQFHVSKTQATEPESAVGLTPVMGGKMVPGTDGSGAGHENKDAKGHEFSYSARVGQRAWPWIMQTGLAAAVLLIAFLLVGAVSDMQIQSGDEGWSVSFGAEPPVIQQGIDEQALAEIIELIREENRVMAATLVEESQLQQEEQIHELMTTMLEYMETRREADLVMLANGLARVDEQSYQRFQLTSEAVNGLYNTLFTGIQEQN